MDIHRYPWTSMRSGRGPAVAKVTFACVYACKCHFSHRWASPRPPWISIDFHGPWISMDIRGNPCRSGRGPSVAKVTFACVYACKCHFSHRRASPRPARISMDIHGFPWISIEIHAGMGEAQQWLK